MHEPAVGLWDFSRVDIVIRDVAAYSRSQDHRIRDAASLARARPARADESSFDGERVLYGFACHQCLQWEKHTFVDDITPRQNGVAFRNDRIAGRSRRRAELHLNFDRKCRPMTASFSRSTARPFTEKLTRISGSSCFRV